MVLSLCNFTSPPNAVTTELLSGYSVFLFRRTIRSAEVAF